MDTLTWSSASCFHTCPYRYYWRYEEGLRPKREEEGEPLLVGTAGHAGMETYAETGDLDKALDAVDRWRLARPALGPEGMRRVQQACKAKACVRVATIRWPDCVDEPEKMLDAPIRSPHSGRASRSFRFGGKYDGAEQRNNTVLLCDWKFTTDPERFIQTHIDLSVQLECYALAEQEMTGRKVIGVEYRLVKQPTIKLKLACRTRKVDQTPQEYEDECYEWIAAQTPGATAYEKYVTPRGLEAAQTWLWETAGAIRDARRLHRWFQNPSACYDWNRCCVYMPLCQATVRGDPVAPLIDMDFETAEKHPELKGT